jgi:hypothetical protein
MSKRFFVQLFAADSVPIEDSLFGAFAMGFFLGLFVAWILI